MRTRFGSIKSLLGLAVPAVLSAACSLTLSINASTPAPQAVPVTQIVLVTEVVPVMQDITTLTAGSLEVFANQGWQETGLQVRSGQQIRIDAVSGQISDDIFRINGGAGSNYVCGNPGCCEPLPDAPRDALLGRIGTNIFLIGNGGVITSNVDGTLQLRVNDCDSGIWDNTGSLHVSLTIPRR